MWQEFAVKNFRCFSDLRLHPLSRVNLIAGKNNVGKTALLEAIRLHCDPNDGLLPTKINEQRGFEDPVKAFTEYWAWLFIDKNPAHEVELSSRDEDGTAHRVIVQLTDIATVRSQANGSGLPDGFPGQGWYPNSPCLSLKYEGSAGDERTVWVLGGHGEAWYQPREAWRVSCEFIGSGLPSADRDVEFFSALETAKRLSDVLPSLNILEPRLQKLALAVLGGQSVIHGDIGLNRLVPIPLMGEGLRRLLSILLAIFHTAGGIVLIDEIENGLHYSVMQDVWLAIATAAREAQVQVFATTHSWECIDAAHRAFKASTPYAFRYFRLDRSGKQIVARSFDEKMLDTVEKSDLEVR